MDDDPKEHLKRAARWSFEATKELGELLDMAGARSSRANDDWLMGIGQYMHARTYRHVRGDLEATKRFGEWCNHVQDTTRPDVATTRDVAELAMAISFHRPDERILLMALGRWCDSGFPKVVLDSRHAAMLMSTRAEASVIGEVEPPWPAFVIAVPPDLGLVFSTDGEEHTIERLLVHRIEWREGVHMFDDPDYLKLEGRENRWNIVALSAGRAMMHQRGLPTSWLTETTRKDPGDYDYMEPFDDRDERVWRLLGRLVIGTCCTLFGHRRSDGRLGVRGTRKRIGKHPAAWVFELKNPVTVDCRPAVRDYVAGKFGDRRGPVTVQTLVAGHWKMQPHGPRRELRKLIHVEPYWRGPEDAPIAVRPHKEDP